MLAVSFIGKKFSCDAQCEVADEIDGDGLKLNLRVREICKKYLKPHGPVLATLHVSVSNGRPNDVTKCKELLAFLKDQVLPKTLKLMSLKRLKKIKDEEKNEGANWLRCIWPGKTRKRNKETKSKSKGLQNARGYSSDTENYTQICPGLSDLPDIEARHQASDAGILSTPMLARPQLMRKTNLKANENKKRIQDENVKCSLKSRICQEKGKAKDGKIVEKSGKLKQIQHLQKNVNSNLSTKKDQDKARHDMNARSKTVGRQCVQNEEPGWNSCGDISASDSFIGFYAFNKSTDSFVESNETELQAKSTRLLAPDATGSSNSRPMERYGAQKQTLESFAALYVSKICEVALSKHVKEKSKEFATEFVANVFRIAKCKLFTQQQISKSQMGKCWYEEMKEKGNVHMEEMEIPSFSKVWKYSRAFPAEISESFKSNDSVIRVKECDTCSSSKEDGDVGAKNDRQYEEFLERKMVDSLESINNDGPPTTSSPNSSSQFIDLKIHESKFKSQEYHAFDKELIGDSVLEKTERNIQHSSNEIISETRNEELIETCDMTANEITAQGEVENAGLIKSEKPRAENCQETENTNHSQTDVRSCSDKTNTENCEVTTVDFNPKEEEEIRVSAAKMFASNLSNEALSNNAGSLIPEGNNSEKSPVLKNQGDDKNDNKTEPCSRRRPVYKRTMSDSPASERKLWSPLYSEDSNFHSFHPSALPGKAAPKYVRSSSCPVVSEDDAMFENMLSDHRDVYDSLSKRTWLFLFPEEVRLCLTKYWTEDKYHPSCAIILHVHELWNSGKPMDAIKTCIDLTGMADVEQDTPYTQVSRDYALFLNILEQLPSSCSMWSLDLFVLVLPKLRGFISSQHHTSHVEMACGIIQVVLKKVSVVIRRTSKANKNKDKELKIKVCTNELKEIKDMASDVIQAAKCGNRSNSEDPGSMKSVLKELQLALGTFFEQQL